MFDWLLREGGLVLSWWALVTLAGVAVYPLVARLLGGLPDRGYTLARAAGLLVVGFVFWLLASLGFVRNTTGSMLLAWLIVLVGGLVLYFRAGERPDWRAWWRENRALVITGEVLFLALFFGWALYRAHIPNLTGTEKPMEMMMMSSVMRSETFPPNDGWLSGYAISYYYFGYVISAMLSMLSGINSSTGFNLTISLLFALTGLTTFGVVANLVRSRFVNVERRAAPRLPIFIGLLGALFVVLLGNFQLPLVELPYQMRTASSEYLNFWGQDARLDPKPLPLEGETVGLNQWDHWWWFRASRIVTDYDLNGQPIGIQPIDEFPQFSFLLADNHPHVLALPFAMLALGLALNLLLTRRDPTRAEVFFYGLCLGGLVFLNTWDGPIYMVVLVGTDALRRLVRNGSGRLIGRDWWGLLRLGLALAALTLVLYFPFLISFRSQAGGILPNLLYPTLFRQYFLMFGPFVLILGAFLLVEAWRARGRMNWALGLQVAGGLLLGLLLMALVLVVVGGLLTEQRLPVVDYVERSGGWGVVLPLVLGKRLSHIVTTLVLLAGVVLVVGRLFPRAPRLAEVDDLPTEARQVVTYPPATGFALLLVGAGVVLTLVPEFVYLRDNFGVRINTIFKFYYQAWLLFSVAGAYAVYSMLADARLPLPAPLLRAGLTAMIGVIVLLGLLYPVLGIHNRALLETGRAVASDPAPLTLDGGSTLIFANDYEAITCLGEMVSGSDVVVAEAIGGPYDSGYGRVAALTGLPIVLGWENHEGQWRGPTYGAVVGTRPQDIEQLYTDLRWDVVRPVIERYGIDYIFYGISERNKYGAQGEQKFEENLEVVCERGGSRFYRVTPRAIAAVNG